LTKTGQSNPEEYIYQYLVADVDPATIGEIIGEDLSVTPTVQPNSR
jgi:hypothetical protein